MPHANGRVDFAVWPHNLKAGIFDLWAVNLLVALVPAVDPAAESKVNCVVGRFDLRQGKLSHDAILLDTSRMRVNGRGRSTSRPRRWPSVWCRPRSRRSSSASPPRCASTAPSRLQDRRERFRCGGNDGAAVYLGHHRAVAEAHRTQPAARRVGRMHGRDPAGRALIAGPGSDQKSVDAQAQRTKEEPSLRDWNQSAFLSAPCIFAPKILCLKRVPSTGCASNTRSMRLQAVLTPSSAAAVGAHAHQPRICMPRATAGLDAIAAPQRCRFGILPRRPGAACVWQSWGTA